MLSRQTIAGGALLTIVLLLPFVSAIAASPTPAAPPKPAAPAAPAPAEPATPAPPAPAAPVEIPLGDIAARATEASSLLGNLIASAVPSGQIANIAKTLPESKKNLEAQLAETRDTLETEPTLDTLQNLQQDWQRRQAGITGWLDTLTTQTTVLTSALNQLADLQKTWETTRVSAQGSKAPDPILQQIEATLAAIKSAQTKIQNERAALLELQSNVAQAVTECVTVLTRIDQIQRETVAGIFVPDVPPIWRVDLWDASLAAMPDHVRRISINYWSSLVTYVRQPKSGAARDAALFILLVLLFSAARRGVSEGERPGTAATSAISVFERPYAAALAVTFVFVTSPFFQMPIAARQLLTILSLLPLLRLARPMMSASVARVAYSWCFLFAADSVRQVIAGIPVVGQLIIVSETLTALFVLFWMRRHYRQIIAERAELSHLVLLKLGRYLLIIVLLVALAAGVVGYARLAGLLTPGVLVGGVQALVVFVFLRVCGGLVGLALRVWPLRLLQMVEHHRELLERRSYSLMGWMAFLGWSVRYLSYLGLLDTAWSLIEGLLTAKLERGTLAISLGNILEFVVTVWLAHLLSRFIRFALQEDVYPRINLAPGLSYAASSLLNYILLALGFVAGLGLLGVDFTKVSVLAGAFGVGIGFGLQSIVNNFISGLILLFERPIHVGDMIQLSSLMGRVERIGIRASVIRTLQGAEIIVPNAQLITDQVTNWTLSDQLRRVDLPVGVAYGSEPKKTIDLLEGVARAHPQVLKNPTPRALFMGYGDSSINFELRAWAEITTWQQVHSDLTVAIYDAVYAAGMTFPFPQRDVHLVSDSTAAASTGEIVTKEKKIKSQES
jgi:potassium-dependent mechanosensitive channel